MRSKTWTLNAISLCLLPLLTAGCLSDNLLADHPGTPTGPIEIRMKSYIAGSTMGTRADDVKGIIKEGTAFNVGFAKADEGSSGYSDASFSLVSSTGTVSSSSPYNLTFDPAIYYQTTKTKKTKLIGWHPAGGTLSNGVVSFSALDGETDVMATSLVEGCQNDAITSVTFDHLLTQISVKVYATDDATKALWGGIKSIKVKGKKQPYTLTLPETSATAGTKITTVGFTGTDNLPLVQKDPSNNTAEIQQGNSAYGESNALELGSSDSKTLAGYAMFAPVTGSGALKIELIVETEKGGTQTVEVNAPANNITNDSSTVNGFLAGYSYVITLKFSSAGIAPTVSVTAWQNGTNPGEVTV